MAIELHDAVNGDGLFDLLGKAFYAMAAVNTGASTTIPAEIEDFIEQTEAVAGSPFGLVSAIANLPDATTSWQGAANSIIYSLSAACRDILVWYCQEDSDAISSDIQSCLDYLILQMQGGGDYVDPSTVGITTVPYASNLGDAVVYAVTKRGDGLTEQNILAETIIGTVTGGGLTPSINFTSERRALGLLSYDWPAGSGINVSLSATSAADSLLSNGDFSIETVTDLPDDWMLTEGLPTTHVSITNPAVQTITIAGTPTGGNYYLAWQNRVSIARITPILAYNADASAVQAALNTIPGLEAVTVTATGTSPNYTHTVTFNGVGGAVNDLAAVSMLTGGSPTITQAVVTAGNAGSYRNVALKLTSDAATAITLSQPITLTPNTLYLGHLWISRSSGSGYGTTETLKIELVNSIGDAVIKDPAGADNSFSINCKLLNTTLVEKTFAFAVTESAYEPVYLQIIMSAPLPNGISLYLNELSLLEAQSLYPGGPAIAVFAGRNESGIGDYFTLTATNNRGGGFQEWFNRCFNMADSGFLLPYAGSTNIPDSLIA